MPDSKIILVLGLLLCCQSFKMKSADFLNQ
jgi:hypothetical protein